MSDKSNPLKAVKTSPLPIKKNYEPTLWQRFKEHFLHGICPLIKWTHTQPNKDVEEWSDLYHDVCYECQGYGDDWFINDKGELESFCPYCGMNEMEEGDQDGNA